MYEEKDWVALECCPLCGKERGIAINQRMSKTLPKKVTSDPVPCGECIKRLTEENHFIIYECIGENHKKPKFTGNFIECKLEAFNFPEDIMKFVKKYRFMCATEENYEMIMQEGLRRKKELQNEITN